MKIILCLHFKLLNQTRMYLLGRKKFKCLEKYIISTWKNSMVLIGVLMETLVSSAFWDNYWHTYDVLINALIFMVLNCVLIGVLMEALVSCAFWDNSWHTYDVLINTLIFIVLIYVLMKYLFQHCQQRMYRNCRGHFRWLSYWSRRFFGTDKMQSLTSTALPFIWSVCTVVLSPDGPKFWKTPAIAAKLGRPFDSSQFLYSRVRIISALHAVLSTCSSSW